MTASTAALLLPVNTATKASPAPARSLTQRLDALERANDVRTKRAALKRDLKCGRKSIDELLMDPPAFIETAKVFDMLLAVPKYGRVKTNKVLTTCRISPSKSIGGLSQRQRDELVSMLGAGRQCARPKSPPALLPTTQPLRITGRGRVHMRLMAGATFALCGLDSDTINATTQAGEVTCLTCRGCIQRDLGVALATL